MHHRNVRVLSLAGASTLILGASAAWAAFPPPTQANPATEFTAAVPIDYQNVQTYSRVIGADDLGNLQPRLYWFKYTSNGRTALKLDTLGSNFGTAPGGPVLGSRNQSQIAVYNAAGQSMGITKYVQDLAGNPIPLYPTYSSDPTQWYVPTGFSEAYWAPNQQLRNPHWDADPDDPTGFTGWAAPGNEGNSQKYYPPYYPTTLNEYHVWSTALSPVILDMDGNPVINPSTGQPRPQPGWRYYDRARHGPGTPWNRFAQLPAGEYYFAMSSSDPVFAGDTYVEEVLRAPIHYDPSTQQINQPKLFAPMGAFQYYIEPQTAGSPGNVGQITLNVTQTPAPASLVWVGAQAAGAWDVQTTFNWQNGVLSDQFFAGDAVKFDNSSAVTTVNLTTALSASAVVVDSSQNYTFTGAGGITGAASLTKTGSGNLLLSNTGANNYTGATTVQQGTLEVAASSTIGDGPLNVAGGVARLLPGRSAAVHVETLDVSPAGAVDIGNNTLVIDAPDAGTLADIRSMLQSGYNNGAWNGPGIRTSSGNGGNFGIGYAGGATVTIDYTRFGDADLSGAVGLDDFNALASNFNGTGKFWPEGDFNYDSNVNLDDFNLLAGNFNLSAGPDGVVDPEDWAALLAVVPEPSALLLSGVAASAAMARARRRQR